MTAVAPISSAWRLYAMHVRGLCYLVKSMNREAVTDLEQAATLAGRSPLP